MAPLQRIMDALTSRGESEASGGESEASGGESEASGDESCPEVTGDAGLPDILHVLNNDRRRMALRALREASGDVRINELTESVATEMYGESFTGKQRKRIYVGYYQSHLDTLDDAGVVDWGGQDPIERGENFRAAVWLLDRAEKVAED